VTQPLSFREVGFAAAQSFRAQHGCPFGLLALRHIDNCTDNFDKFSARGEFRVGGRFNVFDGSSRGKGPEFEFIISLVVHRLPSLLAYPFSVIGVDCLQ
jgi:hypothetical protein